MITLQEIKRELYAWFDGLLDKENGCGAYRMAPGKRCDLYASCDIAISRAMMGEDLLALPQEDREHWIGHICSFSNSYKKDGSFEDTHGHSPLHANGMVIGALGVLGGQTRYPNRLYDAFSTPDKVEGWLSRIDWVNQWSASHLFWGGIHCFSMGSRCTQEWLDTVFNWLDQHLNPVTGFWDKDVPCSSPEQPLGGFVHIYPIYQHHGRPFLYPERVIDSVLSLQRPDGGWLKGDNQFSYLDLDALYVLSSVGQLVPGYRREDIRRAVTAYAALAGQYYSSCKEKIFARHPHDMEAVAGCFGLLQQLMPEQFQDTAQWTDIFSDRRLYQTGFVEKL